MKLANSTIVITGGASGLGAAVARHVTTNGGNAVIADLNEAAGLELASQLGEQATFSSTDVTCPDSVNATLDLAQKQTQPFRGVVNCAGIIAAGKVVGKKGPHCLETFSKVIGVNLIGTFNVIRLAAERFVSNEPNEEGERGVIINTASIAAFEGQMGQVAYSASKAGVAGMTLPLARDLARDGVRVMTIAPGIFDTAMMAGMPDEVRASLAATVPFPSRLGDPEEFAKLATHIMENSMLNGEVIRLDGALRMSAR